jgi:hypothetical protein
MKTITIISLLTIGLITQSCNMSKHYANKRISHSDEMTSSKIQKEIKKPDQTIEPQMLTAIDHEAAPQQDSSLAIENVSTEEIMVSEIKLQIKPRQKFTIELDRMITNHSTTEKPFTRKHTFPKLKLKKKGAFKINSAAKWIDVDANLTLIYILLGVAGALLLIGSVFIFPAFGTVLLYLLLGAALIFAGALAFGLLIMGFLRMCGLDW